MTIEEAVEGSGLKEVLQDISNRRKQSAAGIRDSGFDEAIKEIKDARGKDSKL